jgi:hypothetical protein
MTPDQIDAALIAAIQEAHEAALKAVQPPVAHVLKYFKFAHLPSPLREHSALFCDLANRIACGPSNPETTVALRKLLEAKDAGVRALLG